MTSVASHFRALGIKCLERTISVLCHHMTAAVAQVQVVAGGARLGRAVPPRLEVGKGLGLVPALPDFRDGDALVPGEAAGGRTPVGVDRAQPVATLAAANAEELQHLRVGRVGVDERAEGTIELHAQPVFLRQLGDARVELLDLFLTQAIFVVELGPASGGFVAQELDVLQLGAPRPGEVEPSAS